MRMIVDLAKKYVPQLLLLFIVSYSLLRSIFVDKSQVWGIGFPFYTDAGYDRHVYGPACSLIACIVGDSLVTRGNSIASKILLIFIFIFSLVSSLMTGSRGSILVACVYIFSFLCKLCLKKHSTSMNSLNLFVLFFLLVVIFLATQLLFSLDSPLDYNELLSRTLSFFSVSPSEDESRSESLKEAVRIIFNPSNLFFGTTLFYPKLDSGIAYFTANSGAFSFVLFLFYCINLIKTKTVDPRAQNVIISIVFLTLVGSETVFIPRFLLAIYLSLLVS